MPVEQLNHLVQGLIVTDHNQSPSAPAGQCVLQFGEVLGHHRLHREGGPEDVPGDPYGLAVQGQCHGGDHHQKGLSRRLRSRHRGPSSGNLSV